MMISIGASGLKIPVTDFPGFLALFNEVNTPAVDAADEAIFFNGYCRWADGGSHTISAAGSGKIEFSPSTTTFANAATNLRVGIQDVDLTTGNPSRGDGTFDVYADLVGGTDSIVNGTWKSCTMETGTKTIATGDLISVVLYLTTRGGTDSVIVSGRSLTLAQHFPITVGLAAAAYSSSTTLPNVLLIADDGTLGYLVNCPPYLTANETAGFSSSSTPDEYASVFQVPFDCVINELWTEIYINATTSDAELILYSDALGTPVAERTITLDANTAIAAGSSSIDRFWVVGITPFTLRRDTNYAVAVRPTSTGTVQVYYMDVNDQTHFTLHPGGDRWWYATRSNQSGAFSRTLTRRMQCGIGISQIDDGRGPGRAQMLIGGLH